MSGRSCRFGNEIRIDIHFAYFFSFGLIRPRGSIIKVPESRLSSEKSSAEPT